MHSRPDLGQAPPQQSGALELLERSIAYCGTTVQLVTVPDLGRATPCEAWCLGALLRHLDDSLAALDEAARGGTVALSHLPRRVDDRELVDSICERARGLLGPWMALHARDRIPGVLLGRREVPLAVLAAVGALEITLHSWDVGRALGGPRPVPPALARDLWPVARAHIGAVDRPGRFGAVPSVRPDAGPEELLLAMAGRTIH